MRSREYDAIIVGAGISGAAAAYFLANQGLTNLLILEREPRPAYHASGRSAASVVELDFIPELLPLKVESARFLRHPPPGFANDQPVFDRTGVLLLFDAAGFQHLQTLLPELHRLGVDIQLWSPEQVHANHPMIQPTPALAGAAYLPDNGRIDVDRLIHGYLDGAQSKGATLSLGTAVRKIETDTTTKPNTVTAIHTDHTRYTTRWLINAAGAWAAEVGSLAGATPLPLTPYRRTIAVFDSPPDTDTRRWPLIAHDAAHWYLAPAEAGRLLASPMDQDESTPCDARPDPARLAELNARLREAAPSVAPRELIRSWAGLRTFAADRVPIIGEDPELRGFFWLAGQGGCGIEASPALGRITAELITRGRAEGVDAAIYSPARFTRAATT